MRTNLELYILTLVRDGLGTPYELKARAGLSLGSTIPALARLDKEALVKASEVQSRRSRHYSVTARGLKVLETEWREHLGETTCDLDSILRIAHLAQRHGSAKTAASYLRRASVHLQRIAKQIESEPERFGGIKTKANNEGCRSLRARIESRRLLVTSEEIAAFAERLVKFGTDARKKTKHNNK